MTVENVAACYSDACIYQILTRSKLADIALSFMIGTVWWAAGKDVIAGDIPNIAGVLFFIAAFMAFMSISVLPAFLEDKVIMIK